MYEILVKEPLNPTVTLMHIHAPQVARKAQAGQFIILRVDEEGERIPLTIADYDREAGWVGIVFQIVGATTEKLNHLQTGDCLHDFAGPLGRPTETEGLHRVAVIGGGVGCAIAYPIARKLHEAGCTVHTVTGFRTKDLVIFEKEFAAVSEKAILMTDDGTAGEKGLVTDALRRLIGKSEQMGAARVAVSKGALDQDLRFAQILGLPAHSHAERVHFRCDFSDFLTDHKKDAFFPVSIIPSYTMRRKKAMRRACEKKKKYV